MIHPAIIGEKIKTAKQQHQQRVALLCQIVDDFCPPPVGKQQQGPGCPETFHDNMILKMDMIGRLSGIKGETELLRHLGRHYSHLFPCLPSQSWLWRRLRVLMPLFERFRRQLTHLLGLPLEDIRIIDTVPMPVFKTARPGRGNGFDLISWGYCASKDLYYCGFKLMLSVTPSGIPDFYDTMICVVLITTMSTLWQSWSAPSSPAWLWAIKASLMTNDTGICWSTTIFTF
jgi:hypothetical protein